MTYFYSTRLDFTRSVRRRICSAKVKAARSSSLAGQPPRPPSGGRDQRVLEAISIKRAHS
jgi:hypothetical protein